jgi:hypothetical protein
MLAVAVAAALTMGFLIGLLSFKVKSRWCPHCGSSTLHSQPTGHNGGHHG